MHRLSVFGVFLKIGGEEGADRQDQEAPRLGVGQDVTGQAAGDPLAFQPFGHQGLGDHQIGRRQIVGDDGRLSVDRQFVAVERGVVVDIGGGEQDFQGRHVGGRIGFETQGRAGDRMDEAQDGGMQGLARQSDLGDGGADRGGGAAGAIDGIAQDGRALGRQMNPDLVCAAGLQGAGDTRRQGRAAGAGRFAEGPLDPIVGDRLAPARLQHGHLLAVGGRAADARLDPALERGRRAAGQGDIGAFDVVGREQGRQALVGAVALGRDHDARGVLVQPVDDARSGDAPDAGQAVAATGQQRIDQGAVGRARRRVGGHARRLVDHDQVRILIEDRKRQDLGLRSGGGDGRQIDPVEARLGLGRAAGQDDPVTAHRPLGQQGLETRARQVGKGLGQGLVQADAGCVDPGLQGLGGRRRVFVVDQFGVGHPLSVKHRKIGCQRGRLRRA
ncbi:hypothetical protein LTR94_021753 [Friedmanniomyces endolithicus]|nr:hypothetical protein LTR94_021753 [Friedmanniomyces endolithicus]